MPRRTGKGGQHSGPEAADDQEGSVPISVNGQQRQGAIQTKSSLIADERLGSLAEIDQPPPRCTAPASASHIRKKRERRPSDGESIIGLGLAAARVNAHR